MDKVLVENTGLFKNRDIRTVTGINTFTNTVNISDHGFEDAEKIKYSSNLSAVGGLTNNAEYFVDKIDNNNFRLCEVVGLATHVELKDNGLGTHVFQDPPISVDISGRQGISTTNATATPIIRGNIISVHVNEKGSEYGSTVINDNYKPTIEATVGKNAFLQPFIVNGRVDQIIIKHGGENFFSTPDIIISGDGVGCKAKANVTNGTITSIDIIEKGAGYSQAATSCICLLYTSDAADE